LAGMTPKSFRNANPPDKHGPLKDLRK
jgi:hypothetical protein